LASGSTRFSQNSTKTAEETETGCAATTNKKTHYRIIHETREKKSDNQEEKEQTVKQGTRN